MIQKLVSAGILGSLGGLSVIAQVPATDVGGDYSKYGVIGALVVVILALIHFFIPKLIDSHKESFNRLADEVKDGSERTTAEIKSGNDRVATLLQSTLVQVIKDKRGE